MQGRTRDAEVEYGRVDMGAGGRGSEVNRESDGDTHALPHEKQTASEKLLYSTGDSAQSSVVT